MTLKYFADPTYHDNLHCLASCSNSVTKIENTILVLAEFSYLLVNLAWSLYFPRLRNLDLIMSC
ncbi:hypothetical protein L873DRAFT_980810 [Choiromyces venosus 120613-1]|uniref:Uncharacterized protein n=1 Tax=Choiromyces venosus 120613-1 TaxID=1336337 RepID=A0A3N4JL71_9PEZI|nr:hypothetical protein L873DRAFT_980810 [Choiromyces venosus 120613-1]